MNKNIESILFCDSIIPSVTEYNFRNAIHCNFSFRAQYFRLEKYISANTGLFHFSVTFTLPARKMLRRQESVLLSDEGGKHFLSNSSALKILQTLIFGV